MVFLSPENGSGGLEVTDKTADKGADPLIFSLTFFFFFFLFNEHLAACVTDCS